MKQRYDAQLAAINDFFTRERRIEALRADIATLVVEQDTAAGQLVDATSVVQTAEILGWSQARVREATGPRRGIDRRADSTDSGRQAAEP
ncbi:hypothetical protein [Ilumatobacter sp.]|uniref:hypothetical protein n=1 Tax=Ilumatobacter sp. TaxID=1967498 RepID=UPI003B52370B